MSTPQPAHGVLRGAHPVSNVDASGGRFARMFPRLRPAEFGKTEQDNQDVLMELGELMISHADVPEGEPNPEESATPAGYTYLAQFIGHDITFDPISTLRRNIDPRALRDYRTPRFDLENIYGRGPDDQPYLYRRDGIRMILGRRLTGGADPNARDIPRNVPFNPASNARHPDAALQAVKEIDMNSLAFHEERAIICDPRNDENVILAQLHAMFLRFHNRMADKLGGKDFATVQRSVRWHYQWILLYDFLPQLLGRATYEEFLPYLGSKSRAEAAVPPPLRFYRPKENDAYIPIEFSSAAFRFGHSMVRRRYRLNRSLDKGTGGPFAIQGDAHDDPSLDLRGFRHFPINWAIDWDLFFDGISPAPNPQARGVTRVQPAYQIDTALAEPLGHLPFFDDPPSLPQRNLLRNWRFALPSGEAVAYAMGLRPLAEPKIRIVTKDANVDEVSLADPRFQGAFENNTPLWFYILAEAQEAGEGERLGPVGSQIVMETCVGLLISDTESFVRVDPMWRPDAVKAGGRFGMAELIKEALQA